MDRLPERIDSKFRYVLLASQRAEQMMRGAAPKVELANRKAKQTRIAMEEIRGDHVSWEYGARPVDAPPEEVIVEDETAEETA